MTQEITVQNKNQIFVDNDTPQLLLGNNEFVDGDVIALGADVEILPGLVMSRVRATGAIKPFDSTVVDDSEYIIGLAVPELTVPDGSTVNVRLVNGGRVPSALINFADASTLATSAGVTANQKRVDDILEGLGLDILGGEELTEFDNS